MKSYILLIILFIVGTNVKLLAQTKNAKATSSGNITGAYIQYDMDGITIKSDPKDIETYNILQKENESNRASTSLEVQINVLSKATWRMEIEIRIPSKTNPIVCKMPYSEKNFPKGELQDSYIPSAALYLIHKDASHLYQTEFLNTGNFAITKVENGWVEGTFDADLPSSLGHDNVKITNGIFRFKIPKQLMEID